MINRGGPSLIVRIADQTGAAPAAIASAFAAVRDSYGMTGLNAAIDELDNHMPGGEQLKLYTAVQDLLLDRIVWFLRNVDLARGLADVVIHYRDGIAAVEATLDTVLLEETARVRSLRVLELVKTGAPEGLAGRIANLGALAAAPDIVLIADRTGRPVAEVAATYFAAGSFFRLDRITGAASTIPIADYFDRLALDRARDAIGDAERRLVAAMLAGGSAGVNAVEAWVAARRGEVERIRLAIQEIANSGLTLSKFSLAASLLGDLVKD
jgi:glutamate dehydrogenase